MGSIRRRGTFSFEQYVSRRNTRDSIEILPSHVPPSVAEWFFRSALYINGRWQAPAHQKRIPVVNPSSRRVITHIPGATSEDVDRAVHAAHNAFSSWGHSTAEHRAGVCIFGPPSCTLPR
jgi:hypothetical protein